MIQYLIVFISYVVAMSLATLAWMGWFKFWGWGV